MSQKEEQKQEQTTEQQQQHIDPKEIPEQNKLHIQNLSQSITVETLYNIFLNFGKILKFKMPTDPETQKSKGYAKIAYEQPEYAKKAQLNMNFKTIKENQGQRIAVNKDIGSEQFNQLKSHNLFVKGFPKNSNIEPKVLFEFFHQYGEIVSFKPLYSKDLFSGQAYLLFQDKDKCSEMIQLSKNDKIVFKHEDGQEYKIEISQYTQSTNKKSMSNKIVITGFRKLNDEEFKDSQTKETIIQDYQKKITENFSKYGKLTSTEVSTCTKNPRQLQAVIGYEQVIEASTVHNKYISNKNEFELGENVHLDFQQNQSSNDYMNESLILIKNLRVPESKEEQEKFDDNILAAIREFAEVDCITKKTKIDLTETQKDFFNQQNNNNRNKKQTQPPKKYQAYQIIIQMRSEDEGRNFIVNYTQNKNFRSFFVNKQADRQCTFLISNSQRFEMQQLTNNNNMNQHQNPQMNNMTMQMMMQQQFMQQMNFMNFNQMRRGPHGNHHHHHNHHNNHRRGPHSNHRNNNKRSYNKQYQQPKKEQQN